MGDMAWAESPDAKEAGPVPALEAVDRHREQAHLLPVPHLVHPLLEKRSQLQQRGPEFGQPPRPHRLESPPWESERRTANRSSG